MPGRAPLPRAGPLGQPSSVIKRMIVRPSKSTGVIHQTRLAPTGCPPAIPSKAVDSGVLIPARLPFRHGFVLGRRVCLGFGLAWGGWAERSGKGLGRHGRAHWASVPKAPVGSLRVGSDRCPRRAIRPRRRDPTCRSGWPPDRDKHPSSAAAKPRVPVFEGT